MGLNADTVVEHFSKRMSRSGFATLLSYAFFAACGIQLHTYGKTFCALTDQNMLWRCQEGSDTKTALCESWSLPGEIQGCMAAGPSA